MLQIIERLEFEIQELEKRVATLENQVQAKTTQEFTEDEIRKLKKIAQKYLS